MKENEQISSNLQKYAQPFEMENYLFKQLPLAMIEKLKIGKWKKVPRSIKFNIKDLAENTWKKIITSIVPMYEIYSQSHLA